MSFDIYKLHGFHSSNLYICARSLVVVLDTVFVCVLEIFKGGRDKYISKYIINKITILVKYIVN